MATSKDEWRRKINIGQWLKSIFMQPNFPCKGIQCVGLLAPFDLRWEKRCLNLGGLWSQANAWAKTVNYIVNYGERGVKMFERQSFFLFFLLGLKKIWGTHIIMLKINRLDQWTFADLKLSMPVFNYSKVITQFVQQRGSAQADKQEKKKWHDLKIPLKPHTAAQQWHRDPVRDYKDSKFTSMPLQSTSTPVSLFLSQRIG